MSFLDALQTFSLIPPIKCVLVGDDESELLDDTNEELTKTQASIKFPEEEKPTAYENYVAEVVVDKKPVKLTLWDTAGLQVYDRYRMYTLPQTDVFIVMFAIDSPESLKSVTSLWYPEISDYQAKIILVGNRLHARKDPKTIAALKEKNLAPVTSEQGQQVMFDIGAVRYLEISVEQRIGLKRIFEEAAKAVLHNYESADWVSRAKTNKSLANLSIYTLNNAQLIHYLGKRTAIDLSMNFLSTLPPEVSAWVNVTTLDISDNRITVFPAHLKEMRQLKELDISQNWLEVLPDQIPTLLPRLRKLHVRNNRLNTIPMDLHKIKDLDVTGNPLAEIHPSFRGDINMLKRYLVIADGEELQQWDQVKLMLVGQEGVGKTTLLHRLQNNKFDQALNLSTNGVQIGQVELYEVHKTLSSKKNINVKFNVWDFGGQAVFHSTHRFFMTMNSVYIIMYDVCNPKTYERIRYWIQQINAIVDNSRSKPILIVGTHADQLAKNQLAVVTQEMDRLYPKSANGLGNPNQIVGHMAISLSSNKAVEKVKKALLELVVSHPNIGIGRVKVPKSLLIVQDVVLEKRQAEPYLVWTEYLKTCADMGITEEVAIEVTRLLHSIGTVTWYDTPRLRDLVVINPQWLANALSSVVSFLSQSTVAKKGGMITWHGLKSSLRIRFPEESVHPPILFMLELYEIILQIRTAAGIATDAQLASGALGDDQLFFVPSLLSEFNEATDMLHPALTFWQHCEHESEFARQFSWGSYPSGFFPRVLLRLFHTQLIVLACWLDAAVVMSRQGNDWAFLRIIGDVNTTRYTMEVSVRSTFAVGMLSQEGNELSLVSELMYVIVQLHIEMYPNLDVEHLVVLPNKQTIPFTECIDAALTVDSKGFVYDSANTPFPISSIAPDLVGYKEISPKNLTLGSKLGKGGFGVVYKGTLTTGKEVKTIAAKELLGSEGGTVEPEKLYEFQHEMIIMSKLQHENLVQLFGVTKQPLRLVLEFIPNGDLHHLLLQKDKFHLFTLRWRLKMAIDIADGVRYLQSQTPPICHSDLRAPNIFVSSLDDSSDCVGKVADFGAAQQVYPFASKMLCNFSETAPETWGETALKTAFYTEKADIFSYAIILWRLVGYYDPKSTEVYDDPYYHLQEGGKPIADWKLRELVTTGTRPLLSDSCPSMLKHLINQCWELQPSARPSFLECMHPLIQIYVDIFGTDSYIKKKMEHASIKLPAKISALPAGVSVTPNNWSVIPLSSVDSEVRVTSLINVNENIWAFTSDSRIIALSPDGKIVDNMAMSSPSIRSPGGSSSAKLVVVCVGDLFIWVASAEFIFVLHAKSLKIISMLNNETTITAMVYLSNKTVWVADVNGWISIWHLSLQKCSKIKAHDTQCAQCMTSMGEFMWMGVGKDVVVLNHQTAEKVASKEKAHGDRIQDIVAIPGQQQVWTCARDGSLCMWRLRVDDEVGDITLELIKKIIPREDSPESSEKFLSLTLDGTRVCSKARRTDKFEGGLIVWDTATHQSTIVPLSDQMKQADMQCVLDSGKKGFWCGLYKLLIAKLNLAPSS